MSGSGRTPIWPGVRDAIRALVEPFNLGGLCRAERQHWYGCEASDLYESAPKIGANRDEITAMLRRAGFTGTCVRGTSSASPTP